MSDSKHYDVFEYTETNKGSTIRNDVLKVRKGPLIRCCITALILTVFICGILALPFTPLIDNYDGYALYAALAIIGTFLVLAFIVELYDCLSFSKVIAALQFDDSITPDRAISIYFKYRQESRRIVVKMFYLFAIVVLITAFIIETRHGWFVLLSQLIKKIN